MIILRLSFQTGRFCGSRWSVGRTTGLMISGKFAGNCCLVLRKCRQSLGQSSWTNYFKIRSNTNKLDLILARWSWVFNLFDQNTFQCYNESQNSAKVLSLTKFICPLSWITQVLTKVYSEKCTESRQRKLQDSLSNVVIISGILTKRCQKTTQLSHK